VIHETGFDAESPLTGIHRTVVLVALVLATFGSAAWLVAGWIVGVPGTLVAAAGPATLALVAAVMHRRRRYRGDIILGVAVIEMLVAVTISGRRDSILASGIVLIVVLASGVPFVPATRRVVYVAFAGAVAAGAGLLWAEGGDHLRLAAWMGISSVAMVGAFSLVSAASSDSARRYRTLFDGIPVAAALQDWRAVRRRIEQLTASGVTDLRSHLLAHPAEFRRLVTSVRVVGVNDAYVALLSAPDRASLLGHWDEQRINDASIDYFLDEFERIRDGLDRGHREWKSSDFHGRPIWLRIDWQGFRDGIITGADRLVTATDLTPLKSAEEELRCLLDDKDRLVASISHELRTPLTAVIGFAEVLDNSHNMTEEEEASLRRCMLSEARDMADIIEDLLVAARARMGEISIRKERVDLAGLAASVARAADAGFVVEAEGSLPAIADGTRVTQILRNLTTNSVKHGGSNRRVSFGQTPEGAYVEVRDDGEGVPPKYVDDIFDPYVSGGDRVGMAPSMGLGLWISRSLAELMQGDLSFRREAHETVFRLTLPKA